MNDSDIKLLKNISVYLEITSKHINYFIVIINAYILIIASIFILFFPTLDIFL